MLESIITLWAILLIMWLFINGIAIKETLEERQGDNE